MKTAHQSVPAPQQDQDAANKKYVDDNGGGGSTLVFRPGSGNTGPVVFDDFKDLYDNALSGALASGGGQCTILIDDSSQSPAVLDPGDGNIFYDFTGVRLVGIDPHRQVPLNVRAGYGESNNLTITGASYFEGLLVRSSGSDTAFIAQNDQEIVLKNTTFNGAGQYAYDFLSVSGCILHLGDESRLQRTSNAAIRVNGNALTLHVDGSRAVIDYLGAAGFVGGSIDVIIGSASARVDKQQDILLQTFTMAAASGFWNGNPNTKLTATRGTIVSDQTTGNLWENTDGAMAWSAVSGGGAGVDLEYQPPLGIGPAAPMQFQPLAIKPDGSKVYVGSNNTAEIWRILTATNTWDSAAPESIAIAATIQWPNFFVLNADGSKLYIATSDNMTAITVIDTATNTVIGTVSGLSGSSIASMKMHPNGTELWVHQNPNIVDRVSVVTDAVVGTFVGGFTTNTYDTGFSAGGTKYYVTGRDASGVTTVLRIYSTSTYTQVGSFASATQLIGPCAIPDNSEMWFTAWDIGDSIVRIYRFSVATNAQVGTPIDTTFDNSSSYFMVAKSDSSKVYVLQAGSGDVNVVSVGGLAMTNTISLGGGTYGDMEIHPSNTFLYVSSGWASPAWVKVVDLSTETVVDTITNASVTPPAAVPIGAFDTLLITGARLSDAGGGTGSVNLPVVFDDGATPYQNIKANRQSGNASLNDQTKTGITNFGSGGLASGNFATIGGGQGNLASGLNSTIPGGNGNTASGQASVAMGDGSTASALGSMAANLGTAEGDYSAAFNYATVSPGAEGSVAFSDGQVGNDSYGSAALNGGTIGPNCTNCYADGDGYVDDGSYSCHAEGSGFIDNNGNYCHAEGRNTYIGQNVNYSHVEGNGCSVAADSAHAEGDGAEVAVGAYGAHAEGGGTNASGPDAHAEGTYSEAIGYYAHAQNGATVAFGEGSHSEGDGCYAEGDWSHAQGSSSRAKRETQFAHGGGYGGGFGGGVGVAIAQTSWLQYRSFGTIAGPAGTGDLRFGVNSGGSSLFVCEDLRSYDFVFTAVVNGRTAGPTYKTRTIKIKFNARCVAGVATIAGSGAGEAYGDVATWSITPSAVGNAIVLTFNTGADTDTCYVSGNLEFVEVRFAA